MPTSLLHGGAHNRLSRESTSQSQHPHLNLKSSPSPLLLCHGHLRFPRFTVSYFRAMHCSVVLPLFLAALALGLPFAGGQPLPWQVCGQSGNYESNSTYQANLKQLSNTLPKNASSSPTLFGTATVGTVPDIVYALTLCRGDANSSACDNCVTTAFQDAQQLCAYNKDAYIYYDTCFLRFSNQNFLASTDYNYMLRAGNSENVTALASAFDAAVGILVNTTAEYAANSSKRFGTGEEGFDRTNPKIYGLAQCTPDMSTTDCRRCLSGIIALMPQYFSRKKGGRILGVRCNYRYELYPFFNGGPLLQLPAPPNVGQPPAPEPTPVNTTSPAAAGGESTTRNRAGIILAIVLPVVAAILVITAICYCFWRRPAKGSSVPYSTIPEDIQSIDSLILDISTLRVATDNFAESNKLGEGGFGVVYKGVLPDYQKIAVKRLSKSSGQGIGELKNELVLVAKLQHKNLVRLVGVCLEEQEKLLVYEYMPNKSLDTILFDSEKSKELDWGKRFKIVDGIARGLQYLHEDSQLKIVHRDLKVSNVLLDSDYNPKISDFGLARLFGGDQTQDITSRIVGTYGYMSPEYAMHGYYSVKSDVFSFGVLILEIVTGRKNSASYNCEQSIDLLSLIWEHWTMGSIVEIMDPSLSDHNPGDQMLKCVHIGLLCVQENYAERPTMSTVNIMLSSSTVSLNSPSRPAFCILKGDGDSNIHSGPYHGATRSTGKAALMSPNEVSLTELEPR